MAAYYYVKSGGTATGDAGRYTTQQTGSFADLGAANYYATIDAALDALTPSAGGDFICVSDIHSYIAGASVTHSPCPAGDTIPLTIMSVSDTAIDTYAKAAAPQEGTTGSKAIHLNGTVSGRACYEGMFFSTYYRVTPGGLASNSFTTLRDCTLRSGGSNDVLLYLGADGGLQSYIIQT